MDKKNNESTNCQHSDCVNSASYRKECSIAEKSLTGVYKKDGVKYFVKMKTNFCDNTCHFCNSVFGETVFHRDTEVFLRSNRMLDENYLRQLRLLLKVWKTHFVNY